MSKARRNKGRRSKAQAVAQEDETKLWEAFTKGVDPLTNATRVSDASEEFLHEIMRRESVKSDRVTIGRTGAHPGDASGGTKGVAPRATVAVAKGGSRSVNPPAKADELKNAGRRTPGAIDSKHVRRIGRGREGVDARIDLHGMRQNEAHGALRGFLMRSVAKGHRMVLVITGKGTRSRSPDDEPGFESFVHDDSIGRGILRRRVPAWLQEPDLKPLVVGYTTAHIRHGGEGAIYVQLRRRK